MLFKHWSNKSYAVFNSIGKVIHIGFILPIVSGLTTVKAVLNHDFLPIAGYTSDSAIDEDGLLEDVPEYQSAAAFLQLIYENIIFNSEFASNSLALSLATYLPLLYLRPVHGLFYFVDPIPIQEAWLFFVSGFHVKS